MTTNKESINRYITQLRDTGEAQIIAINALIAIGIPAVPQLIEALKEEDTWFSAAHALAQIGKPAISALVPLLEEPRYSNFAFHTLAHIGEEVRTDFINLLSSTNAEVRMWAVIGLRQFPSKEVYQLLCNYQSDPDPIVRQTIKETLHHIIKSQNEGTL